ncbi:hypothetical protein AXX17_AT4G06760 [Arabidopsis thaliana]|uniref:Uncharacterized protein n=1 Tax=Arabidopsis thaliana TaxID=3702 RepID=A0A178V3F8_ARATH|nr:hypothetical protein AXX17_AT4G06760 [Arabidopsis thaliana]
MRDEMFYCKVSGCFSWWSHMSAWEDSTPPMRGRGWNRALKERRGMRPDKTSLQRMKRYGDRGSPCRMPRCGTMEP